MNKFFKKILPAVALSVYVAGAVCATSACASKDYSEEFSKLQQQIDDLKNQNNSNLTEIESLKQQIVVQQKLIESLQNVVNTTPKTYKVGETFTYSYQGVDFFSITFIDYSTFIIKNLNMISFIPRQIITAKLFIDTWNNFTMPSQTIEINKEYTVTIPYSNEVIKCVFGYPLSNDGILPYAIFDLTTSV